MQCATIREGQECTFMAKNGCTYSNGECEPAVDPCNGCGKLIEVDDGIFCKTCPAPATKWRLGLCNQATHVKEQIVIEKTKLNPIKASKRKMRI